MRSGALGQLSLKNGEAMPVDESSNNEGSEAFVHLSFFFLGRQIFSLKKWKLNGYSAKPAH